MKERRRFGRTLRWTWAGVAAILFHVALYWGVSLARSSDQKLRRQARQFTEVQYFDAGAADRSELLSQQMSLFDPRPLMLPTQWNAANARELRDLLEEEGEIFPDYAPLFELEDGNYIEDFGNVPASYDQLSAAQVEFTFPPFKQIGRRALEREYAQPEGIAISLIDPGSGASLGGATLYNTEALDLARDWPAWSPVTLLANVENSFQVGGLTVVSSSGYDEVDLRLRAMAQEYFPELGRFRDGVYLLEIVP